MWLLIFPEGTNLSGVTRQKSAQWAEKTGVKDMKHQLLPRTTGLQFCLSELRQTTNWLYDCTIAYEGITLHNVLNGVATLGNTSALSGSNLVPVASPVGEASAPHRYSGLATFEFDNNSSSFGAGNDLGVYMNGGGAQPNSQVYTTGVQALKGESVWNLSALGIAIPASGTTGNITSGYLFASSGGGHGIVLGQYQVIPEPSAVALGALAAGGLFLRRRRA
ncbi:MAG: lysophospholipid acyltransferase family protein [Verrucomicrobiaceae bacterium]|nr:MAG: lysophospholipid acyltransferase family protein [Verrucomicrobiaceae bacterium]